MIFHVDRDPLTRFQEGVGNVPFTLAQGPSPAWKNPRSTLSILVQGSLGNGPGWGDTALDEVQRKAHAGAPHSKKQEVGWGHCHLPITTSSCSRQSSCLTPSPCPQPWGLRDTPRLP